VDNTNGPVWSPIDVVAVLKGTSEQNPDIVTTNSGTLLLPKALESLYYDADGNLTGDSLWTNTWNAENRLMACETVSAVPEAGKAKQTWSYYPDGRWHERVIFRWNGGWDAYATNRFVWDGHVLLAVLDHTNGLVQGYLRGLDLSGSLQGAGSVGGLLAVSTATNGTHFYAFDGNGNVTALVDAGAGSVSAVYEYDPFGNELRATGPMANENLLRFSSQFVDHITGDMKYLFRTYRPSLGRWLSTDPINELGSLVIRSETHFDLDEQLALYAFLQNDPFNNIDVHGLFNWPCFVACWLGMSEAEIRAHRDGTLDGLPRHERRRLETEFQKLHKDQMRGMSPTHKTGQFL